MTNGISRGQVDKSNEIKGPNAKGPRYGHVVLFNHESVGLLPWAGMLEVFEQRKSSSIHIRPIITQMSCLKSLEPP